MSGTRLRSPVVLLTLVACACSATRRSVRFIRQHAKEYGVDPRQFSPIRFVSPGSAPSLIVHGDADTTVPMDQGETMYAALTKAGVLALCRNCVRCPRNSPTNADVYRFTSRRMLWREVVEATTQRGVSVSLGERRPNCFPSVLLQLLGHLSALESTVCERPVIRIAQNLPSRTSNLTSRVVTIAYRDAIPVVEHEL